MVKYNGWAFMSAYMSRSAKDPIAYNPEDITGLTLFLLEGMDYRIEYVLTNYEIIGRFSTQKNA